MAYMKDGHLIELRSEWLKRKERENYEKWEGDSTEYMFQRMVIIPLLFRHLRQFTRGLPGGLNKTLTDNDKVLIQEEQVRITKRGLQHLIQDPENNDLRQAAVFLTDDHLDELAPIFNDRKLGTPPKNTTNKRRE
jgi:hypothetical protein